MKLLVLPGDGIGPEITTATLAMRRQRPGFDAAARAIEAAIDAALQSPDTRTVDLGGILGTRAFSAKIAAAL